MTKLSVNINKIAVVRNSRGGNLPDVVRAALDIERFGADGITVHPRPDARHIRYDDVRDLKRVLTTELNIEGNPIPSFIDLVSEVVPAQVTLVPDAHDAITSNAEEARRQGLGLNAGHDLSLENLHGFVSRIPWTDEVSIGHALICDALYYGLENTVQLYRRELKL